ncbi:MAG: thiamine pyrophosphate-binding protein [Thermodesulfobacteriota bacterium]
MNGGEVVVKTMISRGIDTVFFVPGETNTTIFEALSRHQKEIRSVPTRLESAAVFAADAYAAIRKRPACVLCSRAPGATNSSIGIHNAKQASRPVVLIIASIPRQFMGREAFQEINFLQMYAPIAKAVFDVSSFNEVGPVLARALDLSVSGRPGPVVVAISKSILDGETGDPAIPKASAPVRLGADPEAAREAARMIAASQRPIIVAGEIVNFEDASKELERFADVTGAGVMTAFRQQDLFRADHPANFGQLTFKRPPYQHEALKQADLFIAVGTRLDSTTTANYAMFRNDQKLIMIYPEPAEFSQWQPDVALCSHTAPAMQAIAAALSTKPSAERLAWRDNLHRQEVEYGTPGDIESRGELNLIKVIKHFNSVVPNDAIMVSDVGISVRMVAQYYRYNRPNTQLGGISGSMGYGVPGGFGAQLANPKALVFVWVGDGSFLMTGNECAAIVQEKLPVKLMVLDNNYWGSIFTNQRKRFPGWDFGARLQSPDFAALGRGYGMPAWTVRKTDEFPAALAGMMNTAGPAMIHMLLDPLDALAFFNSPR